MGLGGGDIARVLTLDKSVKTSGRIKNALENIKWHRDEARKSLSVLDPVTWAPLAKAKNITIMNAEEDELINQEHGFKKYVEGLKIAGINPEILQHDGNHFPDHKKLGVTKTIGIYMRLLGEINTFLGGGSAATMCQ